MVVPLKPHKTFKEQLKILKNRGVVISDEKVAIEALRSFGYYRLSGYFYHLRDGSSNFPSGLKFEQIIMLYEFDNTLRNIVMRHLGIIEIYLRTQISNTFAKVLGNEAHYDKNNFKKGDWHIEFLKKVDDWIEKNKDIHFVSHHIKEYDGRMPLWVMLEITPFSSLSKLYNNMKPNVKEEIGRELKTESKALNSWLWALSILRNTCAHYGRIYNTQFTVAVILPKWIFRKYNIDNRTFFAYVVCVVSLLPTPKYRELLLRDLNDLLNRYSEAIDLNCIGFPSNWCEILTSIKF